MLSITTILNHSVETLEINSLYLSHKNSVKSTYSLQNCTREFSFQLRLRSEFLFFHNVQRQSFFFKFYFLEGVVGISLNSNWYEPADSSNLSHIKAAEIQIQFTLGWFANPIFIDGKYPQAMRDMVK